METAGQLRWWGHDHKPPLVFIWEITAHCNYRCAYCWFDPIWNEYEAADPGVPAEKWLEAWTRIHRMYGQARISIVGGEPTVSPAFVDIIPELAKMHRLLIISNLSLSKARLESILDRVTPASVHIDPSFHASFAAYEPFLEKALLLKERGFEPTVNFVIYPPTIPRILEYKAAFESVGVKFQGMVFHGKYNGRQYPQSFNDEEKTVIRRVLPDHNLESRMKYEVGKATTLGKKCFSGTVYASVKPSGEVCRCGRATGKVSMGNLLSADFHMEDAGSACPFENCDKEFYFLEDELRKAGRLDEVNRVLALRAGNPS